MSDSEDEAFVDRSDDEDFDKTRTSNCSNCGVTVAYYLSMCDACSDKLKENLFSSSAVDEGHQPPNDGYSSNGDGPQNGDGPPNGDGSPNDGPPNGDGASNDGPSNDAGASNGGPPNGDGASNDGPPNGDGPPNDGPHTDLNDDKNKVDEDMTFDLMLAAVFSCGAKEGRVTIHGHDYSFSACPKMLLSRGGGTTMIITEFSKSIPDLFGYYYYGGSYTRCYSCMAFTMTECGNLFMGVMETMCSRARLDAVIYFPETNTCRIMSPESGVKWRQKFKLNCILHLTIDLDKAKRYVATCMLCHNSYLFISCAVHSCLCFKRRGGFLILHEELRVKVETSNNRINPCVTF